MTILEDSNAKPTADGPRVTRPTLDRDAPIRNWATLFGPPAFGPPAFGSSAPGAMPSPAEGRDRAGSSPPLPGALPGVMGQTLSDAVGQGYRVINDYLSQGQRYAEAMRWPDVAAAAPGAAGLPGQDPQQLLRRLMQYGADFAGIWFEVWSRMGWPPPGAWPGAPGAPSSFGAAGFPASAARDAASAFFNQAFRASTAAGTSAEPAARANDNAQPAAPAAPSAGPERFFVSVTSERRVQSVLELRRGPWSTLVAHGLRPEGHDAPTIKGVTVEALEEQSTLRVCVDVPADQPPGVYNGMIIDAASNLPRGTLTITVEPPRE